MQEGELLDEAIPDLITAMRAVDPEVAEDAQDVYSMLMQQDPSPERDMRLYDLAGELEEQLGRE